MAARTATAVATGRRARKKKSRLAKWIKRIFVVFLILFSVIFIGGYAMFATQLKAAEAKLDNLPALMANLQVQPTIIYSADGQKLYIISNEYRRPVESKDIPQVMKDAIVAAEDIRFYQHKGVDIRSL